MGERKLTYEETKANARKVINGQNESNARLQKIYHKIMSVNSDEQYEVRE